MSEDWLPRRMTPDEIDLGCRAPIVRRTGDDALHDDGVGWGSTLLDFWRWAGSDLITNTLRGPFAEFLVAGALGARLDGVREPWASVDLVTPEGAGVQVRSAAYVQSWFQRCFSDIRFDIRPKRVWDPETNGLAQAPGRHAQVYVFALLAHRCKGTIDPLNVAQWRFYVLPTRALDFVPTQSISLGRLAKMAPALHFGQLRASVRHAGRQPAVRETTPHR